MVPELVKENCTGCALCHAVCPVPGTIEMVPMDITYKVQRTIYPDSKEKPEWAIDYILPRSERWGKKANK